MENILFQNSPHTGPVTEVVLKVNKVETAWSAQGTRTRLGSWTDATAVDWLALQYTDQQTPWNLPYLERVHTLSKAWD